MHHLFAAATAATAATAAATILSSMPLPSSFAFIGSPSGEKHSPANQSTLHLLAQDADLERVVPEEAGVASDYHITPARPRLHHARSRLRQALCLLCFSVGLLLLRAAQQSVFPPPGLPASAAWSYFQQPSQRIQASPGQEPRYNDTFHPDSLNMTDETCSALFPRLGYELDRSVLYYRNQRQHITTSYLDNVCNNTDWRRRAHIRAVVYNGQLFIRSYLDPAFTRGPVTLALLHQALSASPEPIPNIELCFGLEDRPARGTFGLDRPANPRWWFSPDRAASLGEVWLQPDYGFLTWPEHVGSYRALRSQIAAIEAETPWSKKIPRLLWRGSARVGVPERRALLEVTKPYSSTWSDVHAVNWDNRENVVGMADHCKWRYNVSPEGTTYTGRLRNLFNCRGVVLMHAPQWVTFWMHLLDSSPSSETQNVVYIPHMPWWRARLPTILRRQLDWANLPWVMDYLLTHDERAQRIAQNQWDMLRNRYLTPAAVACYWRRAVRAYASVQDIEVGLRPSDIRFPEWLQTLPPSTQMVLRDAMHSP